MHVRRSSTRPHLRRFVAGAGIGVASLLLWALAGAGTVTAASTTLYTSSTPGFAAGAATVPAGVCFVTIQADGGHGGSSSAPASGGSAARRLVSNGVAQRLTLPPCSPEPA